MDRRGKGERLLSSAASNKAPANQWLQQNGASRLQLLFRAVVLRPVTPILLVDSDGQYHDASAGVGKLLGVPAGRIIGRKLDDFAQPASRPRVSQLWRAFLASGRLEGKLNLLGRDGLPQEVEFTAKRNVLPEQHLLVLRDNTVPPKTA